MFWSPVIACHTPGCAKQNRLPYPTPPEITENPPSWPKGGWPIVFVCPSCGHGYEYLALEVQWRQFPTPGPSSPLSPTIALCCEFECGTKAAQ